MLRKMLAKRQHLPRKMLAFSQHLPIANIFRNIYKHWFVSQRLSRIEIISGYTGLSLLSTDIAKDQHL